MGEGKASVLSKSSAERGSCMWEGNPRPGANQLLLISSEVCHICTTEKGTQLLAHHY